MSMSVSQTVARHNEQNPTHFSVGVQTDYRESETQTDPYCPDYVIKSGTAPSELLQLAALTWGHGLPAGVAEVEMIQRQRAKRAWEATLPPLSDLCQRDKRRRMMEEMGAKEWAHRDGEIQKLHEARLAVIRDCLRQRDEAQKEVLLERQIEVYYQHLKDQEVELQRNQNDYNRSMRKLEAKWRNVMGKQAQPEIDRDDTHSCINKKFKRDSLDTSEGLLKPEVEPSALVLKTQVKIPKLRVRIINNASRAVELMKKYKALRDEDTKQVMQRSLETLGKKPVPRPVTPSVEEPPEVETERAVIYVQKQLKGRRIQDEMFKGKENHLALIQELKSVHTLQREEHEPQRADKELVMTLKKRSEEHRHQASQDEASQAGEMGAELADMFHTLSKELIHLQEERRIHAFTLLAERDRCLREAEERGRREVEECRRREEDEIFRQVVQVNQETVDMYLEDIILETLNQRADQQAREEIHRRAREVNDMAYAEEESRNDAQSNETVSELVSGFLIPEIEKISVRQRLQQRQQRRWQVADSLIQESAEHSEIPPSTPGTSQSI